VNDTAELIATAALGTGGGGLVGHLISGWATRKKIPAEVDNLIVEGAEIAVQTLSQTLVAETARANRAEALVRQRDAKIEALEAKIDALQTALDAVREELHAIRKVKL
jgi:uncharacterized protein YlxW (UPF0749 family)